MTQIHIFPEGRIKQEELHELRRFKWGISRMLMECERVPLIVPVWIKGKPLPPDVRFTADETLLSGFEQVMDEPRVWPNYLPRTGKDVTILYGEPMNAAVEPLLAAYRAKYPTPWRPATYERPVGQDLEDEPDEVGRMRSEIAEAMRQGLMQLGQRVDEVERGPPSRIAGW